MMHPSSTGRTLQLYTSPWSSNARRAELAAIELGADCERVVVDLARGEQRAPAFLARNPNGKVPVLVDGDFTLWESYAIMTYLAERAGDHALYPRAPQARAQVNQWLAWCGAQFSGAVSLLNWEHVIKPMLGLGAPEPALVRKGSETLRDCARVLDAQLAHGDYLCGDAPTLADLAVIAPWMHEAAAQFPPLEAPKLRAWQRRMQARDSWRQTEAVA